MYGERLRKLRENKGLLQKELASIIGVSDRQVGHYELEKREPSIQVLKKLGDYFEVSIDYLLGRTDNPDIMILTNKELPIPESYKDNDFEIEVNKNVYPNGLNKDDMYEIIKLLEQGGYKFEKKK